MWKTVPAISYWKAHIALSCYLFDNSDPKAPKVLEFDWVPNQNAVFSYDRRDFMNPTSVFPLRLTAFEELFYYDDRPEYPAVFFCKVLFSESFDETIAQQAVQQACRRHPLVRTRIKCDSRQRLWWHPEGKNPTIQFVSGQWSDHAIEFGAIDLTRESPLRIWHFEQAGQSELVFQLHHAAFDGVGGLQILRDWLAIYQAMANGAPTCEHLPRLEAKHLLKRCRVHSTWRERLRVLGKQWLSLRGGIHFHSRQVIPLHQEESLVNDHGETKPYPTALSAKLDRETVSRLRRFACEQELTVNSLLTSELLLAIDHWQKENQDRPEGTHFRLAIPINERTIHHRRLPASNHCTIINVDRTPEQLTNQKQLRAGIQRQMSLIKEWKLSLNFWRFLNLFRYLPGGLKKQAKKQACRATCALTNLGDLTQRTRHSRRLSKSEKPALAICNFELLAPIRHGTPVAFSVFYFQEELCFSLQYDSRVLRQAEAQQLLDTYLGQLTSHLQDDDDVEPSTLI